jgi:hypothetical protein
LELFSPYSAGRSKCFRVLQTGFFWLSGYLVKLTGAILGSWDPQHNAGGNMELLTAVTKPFTQLIIQVHAHGNMTCPTHYPT